MAIISGTSGNDRELNGTAQADTILGGAGNDSMFGLGGGDLMHGGTGDDLMMGDDGNDVLYGDDGDDILGGEIGADWLYGGNGHDTAWFQDSLEGVQVDLTTGLGHHGTAEGDHFVSIEGLWGTGLDDILIGGVGSTTFEGLGGDDVMIGHGGTDYFGADDWDNGSDIITGGSGADHIDGGSSNPGYNDIDTSAYLASPSGVTVDLVTGLGFGGDAEGDRLYDIENLVGSGFGDTLKGSDGDNKLEGGGGNDHRWGRDGEDRLIGGAGADHLFGGAGYDVQFGGTGADSFAFRTMTDSSKYSFAADVIADFSHAGGDQIDLSWLDAKVSTSGNQAFTFVGTGGFTAEGQVGYQQIKGNTYVQINDAGTYASDMTIKISGLHDLVASDFIG